MSLVFLENEDVISGQAIVYSGSRMALIIHAKDKQGSIRCIASRELIDDNFGDWCLVARKS